jgi:beta-glucosidase
MQQNSDWSAFENRAFEKKLVQQVATGRAMPGHIHNLDRYARDVIYKKTDFDRRFREDLAMAKEMGHNSYRFSICWSRLFPDSYRKQPATSGIQFYHKLLDVLDEHGLRPSATLFHFSTPAWFWDNHKDKRGWEREDALGHFEHFVRCVIDNFGQRIDHWCTLNEPMVYVYNGYIEGIFPPNERRESPADVGIVAGQLLKAHALAYRLLKEDAKSHGREIEVGIAKHTRVFEPYRNYAPLDRITAKLIQQAFVWDFLDALHTGELKLTTTNYREQIPEAKGTQDYIGINYYGRFYVLSQLLRPGRFQILPRDPISADELVNDLDWAIYPHGFYQILKQTHQRYNLPIYVLENGLACHPIHDYKRQHFIVSHLKELWNAIHYDQVDIRGYFHWSLLDNFEWAEGFDPRFGLIHVDYHDQYKRTPRDSAYTYSQIISDNAISSEVWERFRSTTPDHERE